MVIIASHTKLKFCMRGTITNADAAWSLCPKGWGLPTSGDALGTGDNPSSIKAGSFLDLLYPYGLYSKVGGSTSQDDNSLGYNIAKAPLYYVRSGYVHLNLGRSRYSGVLGYNWSSRSYSAATSATRHTSTSVGSVSPSAAWQTSYI